MAAASYAAPPTASSFGPSGPTASYGPPPAGDSYGQPGPSGLAASYAPPPAAAVSPGGPPLPVGPVPGAGPNVSFAAQNYNDNGPLPGRAPSVSFASQKFEDTTLTPSPPSKQGIRESKSTAEFALREYMSLQKLRYRTEEVGIDERLRVQAAHVLDDLRSLRRDVADMVKAAESHRWRRWFTGSIVASFIPAIRAIFRKPAEEKDASNDTEYAFRKSRSLITRIRQSVHGTGRWAGVAFFVFAVLYVFSNEVSLRVSRTIGKRLKRLSAKIESGDEDIDEMDMKLLNGWRWRVLLWNK